MVMPAPSVTNVKLTEADVVAVTATVPVAEVALAVCEVKAMAETIRAIAITFCLKLILFFSFDQRRYVQRTQSTHYSSIELLEQMVTGAGSRRSLEPANS